MGAVADTHLSLVSKPALLLLDPTVDICLALLVTVAAGEVFALLRPLLLTMRGTGLRLVSFCR